MGAERALAALGEMLRPVTHPRWGQGQECEDRCPKHHLHPLELPPGGTGPEGAPGASPELPEVSWLADGDPGPAETGNWNMDLT